jgi:hypothetical protein
MNLFDDKIENIADTIITMNKAGAITTYPSCIPHNTMHTYNKLLRLAVYFINGENNNSQIDRDLLIKKLFFSSRIYEKSVSYLIDQGYSEDQINQFSPVPILNFYTGNIDKPELLNCAESHIYSTMILIFLYYFRKRIADIDEPYSQKDRLQVLENIVLAQSYISVALDSYNSSLGLLYRARENTLERLAPTNEIELQLELDKNTLSRSKGGKPSKYLPFSTEINSYFKSITSERNPDIRGFIHDITGNNHKISSSNYLKLSNTSPDDSTIRAWRKNYKTTGDFLTK